MHRSCVSERFTEGTIKTYQCQSRSASISCDNDAVNNSADYADSCIDLLIDSALENKCDKNFKWRYLCRVNQIG